MTQLQTIRFSLSEYKRAVWHVIAEEGTPVEAVLDPKYWAHVSARLTRLDRIEVFDETCTYFAELLVLDAGRLYAKVALLRKVDLEVFDFGSDATASGYEIKFRGSHRKWSVLRGSDVIKEGIATKGDAGTWLTDHIRSLGA